MNLHIESDVYLAEPGGDLYIADLLLVDSDTDEKWHVAQLDKQYHRIESAERAVLAYAATDKGQRLLALEIELITPEGDAS